MLDMQRMPFAKNKLKNRTRERDTLEKLNQFKEKLRSQTIKTDEDNWMNNRLKFHIDSERAYGLQKVYDRATANTEIGKLQQEKLRTDKEEEDTSQNKPGQDIDVNEVLQHIKK